MLSIQRVYILSVVIILTIKGAIVYPDIFLDEEPIIPAPYAVGLMGSFFLSADGH